MDVESSVDKYTNIEISSASSLVATASLDGIIGGRVDISSNSTLIVDGERGLGQPVAVAMGKCKNLLS